MNVEYKGWIGQICEVRRSVTYKLHKPIFHRERFTWTFYDSIMDKPTKNHPIKRYIVKLFPYPYFPQSSNVPYKGKVDKLDKSKLLEQFHADEKIPRDHDKENNFDVHQNTKKGVELAETIVNDSSFNSPANRRVTLCLSERKKGKNVVSGTVESVSVCNLLHFTCCVKNVRWLHTINRLLFYLRMK